MHTYTLNIDDIDEFVCGTSDVDWQSEYIQLSPGKLNFSTQVVELPGITLFWNQFSKRMRIREAYMGDKLVFGFILNAEHPFLYRGHEFPMNHGVVQHRGAEHFYMVPENIDSLIIHVDRPLAADAGLQLNQTVEMPVPMPALQALAEACRSVTRTIQQLPEAGNTEHMAKMLRNRILIHLQDALTPWSITEHEGDRYDPRARREYLLFRKAENAILKMGLGVRPSIDQLADHLGVSRRNLFYAFDKWVGMGPNAYFEILRLHYLRDRLLAATPSTARVTGIANEFGFNHLGRLSSKYYQFFGEYPKETLAQTRD